MLWCAAVLCQAYNASIPQGCRLLKVMSLLATYESAETLMPSGSAVWSLLKFDLPFCNIACFQVAVGTASLSHVVCVCVS